MNEKRKILLTNDDGYRAKGLRVLDEIMRDWGEVTVVAPKWPQSGMSMAVNIGWKRLAYKELGRTDGSSWAYLDATPASCVKYGLNFPFRDERPDLVMSGVNHGSNATMGSVYSGTLGAVREAALNGLTGIGVSIDDVRPEPDFSGVRAYLPLLLGKLLEGRPSRAGIYYNINFPALPAEKVRGIAVSHQGRGHWEKEFLDWVPSLQEDGRPGGRENLPEAEAGERFYTMVGSFVDEEDSPEADHHRLAAGYISIVAHRLYDTDPEETKRLTALGLDMHFL